MRLKVGVYKDGKLTQGTPLVSDETLRAVEDPSLVLFIRERGERFTRGTLFIFSMPPNALKVSRPAKVSVQETRHSYLVSEAGLSAPRIKLQGNFGWQLKRVDLPKYMVGWGLKSNAKYDAHTQDIWIPWPFSHERGAEGTWEKILEGKVSALGFQQILDGRQSWFALRDICQFYFEENQKRVAQGKAPLELVLVYPLHGIRWVVVPKELPDLNRTAERQGVWPYELELIGVYDDARPRLKDGDDLWS